jgi:hypothetical protein
MSTVPIGPLALSRSVANVVRVDVSALRVATDLLAALVSPAFANFVQQGGRDGVLFDASTILVDSYLADWLARTWAPTLARLGVRRLAVVVDEATFLSMAAPIAAAAASSAQSGVELRPYRSSRATADYEALGWLRGPQTSAPRVTPSVSGQDRIDISWRSGGWVGHLIASILVLGAPLRLVDQAPQIAMVVGLPAFAYFYYAIACVVNSTHIDLGSTLTVTNGPMPWSSKGPFDPRSIESFALKSYVVGRRVRRRLYSLVVRVGGTEHTLIGSHGDGRGLEDAKSRLDAWLASTRRARWDVG